MNLTTEQESGDRVSDGDSDQVVPQWCLRCCIPNKPGQTLPLLLTSRAQSELQKLDLTLDRHRAWIKAPGDPGNSYAIKAPEQPE